MTTYGGSGLPDWKAITQTVARELKGEPNNSLSNRSELRWGRRGSFQLTTDGATESRWKDWESGQGGRGAVSLAGYLLGTDRDGALDWLRRKGYLSDRPPAPAPRKPTATPAIAQTPIAVQPLHDQSGLPVRRYHAKKRTRPDAGSTTATCGDRSCQRRRCCAGGQQIAGTPALAPSSYCWPRPWHGPTTGRACRNRWRCR